MKLLTKPLEFIIAILFHGWNFIVDSFQNKTYTFWELSIFAYLFALSRDNEIGFWAFFGYWILALLAGKIVAQFIKPIRFM